MMAKPAPYVYLAYSLQGNDFTVALYQQLASAGFRVWEFSHENPRDSNWRGFSQRVIEEETFALVVVTTPDAVRSQNVEFEWRTALNAGVPVLPLLVVKTPLPSELGQLISIDFTRAASSKGGDFYGFDKVIEILQSWLETYRNRDRVEYVTRLGANSDQVAREDQLEFKHYVNAFVALIRSPYTQPPLTIGIYGSWGMGKSFLLDNIIAGLEAKPHVVDTHTPVWQRPVVKLGRKLFYWGLSLGQVLFWPFGAILRRLRMLLRYVQAHWFDQLDSPVDHPEPVPPTIHIVKFNAWEFSATEVLWPGLVRKIMDTLEHTTRWAFPSLFLVKLWRNLRSQAKEAKGTYLVISGLFIVLVAALAWANTLGPTAINSLPILQGTAFLVVSGGLFGLVKVIYDAITPMGNWVTKLVEERDYAKQIGYMEETRLDLEFLERRLRRNHGRIVIVIDDLDRCEPQKAVEMLQAVKLLLNFESFIVIMGIDARIITGAVEKHYQGLLGPAGASGYEYLDKIVQIPFRIPEPTPDEVKRFLRKQMGVAEEAAPPPPPPAPADSAGAADENPPGNGQSGGGQSPSPGAAGQSSSGDGIAPAARPRLVRQVDFRDDETPAFEALAEYLRPNPRHIKRIINVYRLVRSLAGSREALTPNYQSHLLMDREATIRWLVICGQWPYTAHMMLEQYKILLKQYDYKLPKLTQALNPKQVDPLTHLFEKVPKTPGFDADRQRMLDYEVERLKDLLAFLSSGSDERHEKGWMDWEELYEMRRYTINFNPAIESEREPEKPQGSQKPSTDHWDKPGGL